MKTNGEKENLNQHRRTNLERLDEVRHRQNRLSTATQRRNEESPPRIHGKTLGRRFVGTLGRVDKEGVEEVTYRTYAMREPMARTLREKATDRFLTAYLINDAFSRKRIGFLPTTKLQKLVFLSEKPMIDNRVKGFNLYFIKLVHGPFSQELEGDIMKLAQVGLVEDRWLEPTEQMKTLLEDFNNLIDRNRPFFEYIKNTNDKYAPLSLERLLTIVYAMPWKDGKTIADLPSRTPMLYPMKPANTDLEFDITEDEAEDLLMNFDPKTVRNFVQAMGEMKSGRLRTHEQVLYTLRG